VSDNKYVSHFGALFDSSVTVLRRNLNRFNERLSANVIQANAHS